jgi:hypothetical protein
MKRFVFVLALAALSFGLASPAVRAQSAVATIFSSGPKGADPTTVHFSWYTVPNDVKAIAVTNIITMSSNPLGVGLVNLATGVSIDPSSVTPMAPYMIDLTKSAYAGIGGGAIPTGFFQPSSPGGGGGGGGGGTPILPSETGSASLIIDQPANGPGTVGYNLYDPEGNFHGGIVNPVPVDGWWALGLGTTAVEPEPLPGVPVNTAGPNTFYTPEPGTLILGGLGIASMLGWRFKNKRQENCATV